MIGLVPLSVGAAGWISLYLNALVQGTGEAWSNFLEANTGTVVGYGLTVTLLPLLAQPFLLIIVAAELVLLGTACWALSKAGRLLDLNRLGTAVRTLACKLPYREELSRLVLSHGVRTKLVETLRVLIPMLEHKTPNRPYRAVLLFVALPTLSLVVASFSTLMLIAAANSGASWIPSVLQFASTAIGYVGAASGVIVLASLGVSLADPDPLPRVTDWRGVLAATAMLYACMVVSTVLAVVA
ncbi:hypothetical protein GBA65_07010 [Rubrobacter marinus]|uniref:Uncharacterized protein n=1 Tax=Rubrobacter marinus TaxID=2653852 RepID=A0A6G8PVS9_9ACTN|nr:hypothetical protein [Rubrobacter marinus]QIN78304.1 hypothetical protein GBA65_07010 [Rubrobacter marinus]